MTRFQSIIPDHIPEEEIPNIIQRASELQSKVIYGNTEYTAQEIQDIANLKALGNWFLIICMIKRRILSWKLPL